MTRAEREQRARHTAYRVIPEILRSSPRAKHGISKVDRILDPQPVVKTPTGPADPIMRPDLTLRITNADTLEAAARISERPYSRRSMSRPQVEEPKSVVTIHNMSSLTRPGGGFLTGSNSQEEFICARTTLFASLFDDLYALPDVGGIYTPDVLVFRDLNAIDLPKRDRFFVNVISAGVPRHPETRGRYDDREVGCSCGVSYCDRDRDIMVKKMKAVLRMAQLKGTKQLVLGAWGCGGLNHPVKEVAKLWRKVIAGGPRQKRANAEQWDGIDEVIFAIPNPTHAREFRRVFEDILAPDVQATSSGSSSRSEAIDADIERLIATATSMELQIETARGSSLKMKLREELRAINHEIALNRAQKAAGEDGDALDEDEDVEDDYVVAGFAGSDGEDNSFYQIDGTTSDSDESEGARSEVYEFRFGAAGDSQTSQDEDELEEINYSGLPESPKYDPQTGWYKGSIDELQAQLFRSRRPGSVSPRSPLVRISSNTADDAALVDGLNARFQRV